MNPALVILSIISLGFSSPHDVVYDVDTDLNNDGFVTVADAVIASRQADDNAVLESALASNKEKVDVFISGTRDRIYERFGAHEEFERANPADALAFYLESGSRLDYVVERCYSVSNGDCSGRIVGTDWSYNYIGYSIQYPAGSVIMTEFVYDLRKFEQTGEIDISLVDRYDFWL